MGLNDTDNINSFIDPTLSSFGAANDGGIGGKIKYAGKLAGCKAKRLAKLAAEKLLYEAKRKGLELMFKFVLAAGPLIFRDCCEAVEEGKSFPYEIKSFPAPLGDGSTKVVPCKTVQDCSAAFTEFNTKMFNQMRDAVQKLAEDHVKALKEIQDEYEKCATAASATQDGTGQQ